MTASSTSLTNCMVFLSQPHDSSHHVSEVRCPPRPIYLMPLQTADSKDHLLSQKWPGSILLIFSLPKAWKDCKNAGTSTTPIAETQWFTCTPLHVLFPLVT